MPLNGGHSNFSGPSKDARNKAGLTLTPEQEQQLGKASRLHFGDARYLRGAAIDCLVHPEVAQ